MDDQPRYKLRELIDKHGQTLCDDHRRCEAMLRDVCGSHKREIHLLVNALKSQVAEEFLGSNAGTPAELIIARLSTKLQDEQGLTDSAARWAVESWAFALGMLTLQPATNVGTSQSVGNGNAASDSLARSEWEQIHETTDIGELLAFERHFGFTSFGPVAKSRRDDLTFEKAEATDALADFAEYVRQFPNGNHATRAKERGGELSFSAAQKADTPAAYELHLKNWPGGIFETQAREWLAQHALRAERLDRAISKDFAVADMRSPTGPAVMQFLSSLPSKELQERWARVAAEKIEAAREPYAFAAAQKLNTTRGYAAYLDRFPNGKHAADAAVALVAASRVRTFANNNFVQALAFSVDGQFLIVCCAASPEDPRSTRIWEVKSGKLVQKLPSAWSAQFSKDSQRVLLGLWKYAQLYHLGSGEPIRTFEGHTSGVYAVCFSPDERHFLSGGDKTLKLWEVNPGARLFGKAKEPLVRTFGHTGEILSAAYSSDGRFGLSGTDDAVVKLWDLVNYREQHTFRGHDTARDEDGRVRGRVKSVAFSPDCSLALSGSWDNTAKLWEVSSGREMQTFKVGSINKVSFSSDGRIALVGGFGGIVVWDVKSGRRLRALGGIMTAVAFSPDGRFAASTTGTANEVTLWDLAG